MCGSATEERPGGIDKRRATKLRRIAALTALILTLPILISEAAAARRGWVLLGELHVTDKADHDRLVVTGARGTFRQIKLAVHRRAVEFRDLDVHFANGETQDVKLRRVIKAGEESRAIDLHGKERTIRSIELRYDAQSLTGKGATVEIFGRH